MDLKKIFALALGVTMFTACSDDDNWNTSDDATVSMTNSELAFKENKGIVNVPLTIEGTLNGPAHVTIEVEETGSSPAMDDVHYLITSKELNIAEDATSVNVELITVDDDEINEARTFKIRIKSAQGIKIGAQNETLVTLKDNDSSFYEKLQGTWTWSDGQGHSWSVDIEGYDEDEEGYNETLYLYGVMGYSWTCIPLHYSYDIAAKKGTVTLLYGEVMAEQVDFGLGGYDDVYTGSYDSEAGALVLSGGIDGEWNDDFTQVTFDSSKYLYLWIFEMGTTNFTGYRWSAFSDIVLTK